MPFGPQPISKVAIRFSDYEEFGCPLCLTGEKRATGIVSYCGEQLVACAHCHVAYTIIPDDTEVVKSLDVELITHPSKGALDVPIQDNRTPA